MGTFHPSGHGSCIGKNVGRAAEDEQKHEPIKGFERKNRCPPRQEQPGRRQQYRYKAGAKDPAQADEDAPALPIKIVTERLVRNRMYVMERLKHLVNCFVIQSMLVQG